MTRSKARGFTIIELIVVLVIIGFIIAAVFASLKSSREKAFDSKVSVDLNRIQLAIQLYYQDNGAYPVCEPGSSVFPQTCCAGTNTCYLSDQVYTTDLGTVASLNEPTNPINTQLAGVYVPYFGTTARWVIDSSGYKNGPYLYTCAEAVPDSGNIYCKTASVTYATTNAVITIPAGNIESIYIPTLGIGRADGSTNSTITTPGGGCMDSQATNFNSSAIYNDGSCVYPNGSTVNNNVGGTVITGCVKYNYAKNYNPSATVDDGSCQISNDPYSCGDHIESSQSSFINCGPGWNLGGVYGCGLYYNPDGAYPVLLNTSQCGYGYGTPTYTSPNPITDPVVYGCTDSLATNYNASANSNDNSCTYSNDPNALFGCTRVVDIAYKQGAIYDDGSCTGIPADSISSTDPTPFWGCTNPLATNYNSSANHDDGSCIFNGPVSVYGCTNPTAYNYDPSANVDDGSCVYLCNDTNATNYGQVGTCTYNTTCQDPAANNYGQVGTCTYSTCQDPVATNYGQIGSCVYNTGSGSGSGSGSASGSGSGSGSGS